jgi:CRP/FNR family transcriptional regulator, cyclic AMP receptor protein
MGVRPGSFAAGLSPVDRQALLAAGRRRHVDAGQVVFHDGDEPREAIVVLRGSLKITKVSRAGREALLELRGPGDLLGEMGAVDGGRRMATAVALERAEILTIPAARFRTLLLERSPIAMAVLCVLTGRLREASERQFELGTTDGLARVCRRLVELARVHGDRVPGGVLLLGPLSQQEVAEWAGVSRDGVVRALQVLRASGVVETGRQRVLIKDLDALERQAAG